MREREGDAQAEPAAAAGDERDLSIEPEARHLELVVARTRAGRHVDGDCSSQSATPERGLRAGGANLAGAARLYSEDVRPTARFTSGDPSRPTLNGRSDDSGFGGFLDWPRAVHVATRLEDVVAVVAEADCAAADGHWAAVLISYDAAAAFEPAMARATEADASDAGVPLAWVAVFDDAAVVRRPHPALVPRGGAPTPPRGVPGAAVAPSPWLPSISRQDFGLAIARVAAFIAAGDTYQVNYTFALEREGTGPIESGDLDAWLDALCTAHEAGYGARLDLGDFAVLSASPELFFERRGDLITARPMKGTAPAGAGSRRMPRAAKRSRPARRTGPRT